VSSEQLGRQVDRYSRQLGEPFVATDGIGSDNPLPGVGPPEALMERKVYLLGKWLWVPIIVVFAVVTHPVA